MLILTDDTFGIVDILFDEITEHPETDAFMEAVSVFALDSDRKNVCFPEDMNLKQKRVAYRLRAIGVYARSHLMQKTGKNCDEMIRECHGMWAEKEQKFGGSFAGMRKLYQGEVLDRLNDKIQELDVLVKNGGGGSQRSVEVLEEMFVYVVLELIEMLKDTRR